MLFLFLKFAFYVLFIFTLTHIIALEGFVFGVDSQYSEASLTESLQAIFVLVSALLFLLAAYFNQRLKAVGASLACLMLMFFIRENDSYLDKFIFDGAWQTLVTILLLSISLYLWRTRKTIRATVEYYSQLLSSGFLICGLLVTLVT